MDIFEAAEMELGLEPGELAGTFPVGFEDDFRIKLCNNCYHAFTATDDDGEQEVCSDCVDWLDDYNENWS